MPSGDFIRGSFALRLKVSISPDRSSSTPFLTVICSARVDQMLSPAIHVGKEVSDDGGPKISRAVCYS